MILKYLCFEGGSGLLLKVFLTFKIENATSLKIGRGYLVEVVLIYSHISLTFFWHCYYRGFSCQ